MHRLIYFQTLVTDSRVYIFKDFVECLIFSFMLLRHTPLHVLVSSIKEKCKFYILHHGHIFLPEKYTSLFLRCIQNIGMAFLS